MAKTNTVNTANAATTAKADSTAKAATLAKYDNGSIALPSDYSSPFGAVEDSCFISRKLGSNGKQVGIAARTFNQQFLFPDLKSGMAVSLPRQDRDLQKFTFKVDPFKSAYRLLLKHIVSGNTLIYALSKKGNDIAVVANDPAKTVTGYTDKQLSAVLTDKLLDKNNKLRTTGKIDLSIDKSIGFNAYIRRFCTLENGSRDLILDLYLLPENKDLVSGYKIDHSILTLHINLLGKGKGLITSFKLTTDKSNDAIQDKDRGIDLSTKTVETLFYKTLDKLLDQPLIKLVNNGEITADLLSTVLLSYLERESTIQCNRILNKNEAYHLGMILYNAMISQPIAAIISTKKFMSGYLAIDWYMVNESLAIEASNDNQRALPSVDRDGLF
jgi:hypothetical protein